MNWFYIVICFGYHSTTGLVDSTMYPNRKIEIICLESLGRKAKGQNCIGSRDSVKEMVIGTMTGDEATSSKGTSPKLMRLRQATKQSK
jgi:hypothetical protein